MINFYFSRADFQNRRGFQKKAQSFCQVEYGDFENFANLFWKFSITENRFFIQIDTLIPKTIVNYQFDLKRLKHFFNVDTFHSNKKFLDYCHVSPRRMACTKAATQNAQNISELDVSIHMSSKEIWQHHKLSWINADWSVRVFDDFPKLYSKPPKLQARALGAHICRSVGLV